MKGRGGDASSFFWPGRSPEGATVRCVLIPCALSESARELALPCGSSDAWYLRAAADALGAPDAFPHSRKIGDPRNAAHYARKTGPRVIAGRVALTPGPGCHSSGYMDHTGFRQLNRVLTVQNNVVQSGVQPYSPACGFRTPPPRSTAP
jgi:hypothetical protein